LKLNGQTDEIAETMPSVQSIFHSCMDQGKRRTAEKSYLPYDSDIKYTN